MTAFKLARADGGHATVVGAGTAQSGGTAIVEKTNLLTSETGETAFVLPANHTGSIFVKAGTVAALVFPPVGGAVNGGSVNASFSVTAAKTAVFAPIDDGTGLNWMAVLSA